MDIKGLTCQKGVVKDQFPSGKEAKDGSVFSRRGGGRSSARRFVLRRVAVARSYPQSVRGRKSSLAGLDLHAGGDRMGFPFPMSQSGSFLPGRRGAAGCLAFGAGSCSLFGRHGGLLYGTGRLAGRSPSRTGARQRQAGRERIAGGLALARTTIWSYGSNRNDRSGCRPSNTPRCRAS